jgi:pimeloyl-ACP methyl ester carboxylesterase
VQICANGIQLHVQRMAPKGGPRASGQHPTVVCIHGIPTDSLASFYLTLAAPVSTAGIEVITYDLRGHGRSTRPPSGYRLGDFVADLSGLLDALGMPGPVHLVGNSYGGTVAFSYAHEYPERAASVVMIESEPATEPWSRKMADVLDRAAQLDHADFVARFTNRFGRHTARLAKAASQMLRTTTIARDAASGPLLSREQIQSVRCPVLAIFGSESFLVDQAELLESLLPDCRSVIVPGHEHSVLVEAPRTVRDLLLSWIAEHDGPALPAVSRAEVSQA